MNPLSKFLNKFHDALLGYAFERDVVAKSVSEVLGVSLKIENIEIKNCVAHITTHPLLKGEILMNKTRILELIRKAPCKVEIVDIR